MEYPSDNFEGTPRQAAVLNEAMSDPPAQAKGLLVQTLVVLGTEFGRTPPIEAAILKYPYAFPYDT